MNHLLSCKNYIFMYFGMPLKKDDINVLFIFIQIDISCKFKSHIQLQTISCDYKSLLPSAMDNHIYSHKDVDLDISYKCMGWNRHDSL
jgi:hypothetical protein